MHALRNAIQEWVAMQTTGPGIADLLLFLPIFPSSNAATQQELLAPAHVAIRAASRVFRSDGPEDDAAPGTRVPAPCHTCTACEARRHSSAIYRFRGRWPRL